MKKILIILISTCFGTAVYGQQPLIRHIYAADPSAHVWSSDTSTLWIYASHDEPNTNHHITMFDYNVFSTKDLINWIDHGRVLSVDDVDWAISHAWAIDAAYWKEKYYLVFCMRPIHDSEKFKIGVAVSDFPEGPFTNQGYIQEIDHGMDPCVFIDDDNQPYLLWAHDRHGYIARLNDDFLSIDPNSITDLTEGLYQIQEGPYLHKYNKKYYLTYPGLRDDKWPEVMYYSIADNPMGPYVSMGQYIPWFEGQAGTNHGSVVKFKGKWLAFHHGQQLSNGNSYSRNLLADELYYNEDGSIQVITPSDKGITNGEPTHCIIKIEAENGIASGGKLMGTEVSQKELDYSGAGYVTDFDLPEDYTQILVQVAKDTKFKLSAACYAEKDVQVAILVNARMLNGGYGDWKDIIIPKSDQQEFTLYELEEVSLKEGNNFIRFMTVDNDIAIDYFILEPVKL